MKLHIKNAILSSFVGNRCLILQFQRLISSLKVWLPNICDNSTQFKYVCKNIAFVQQGIVLPSFTLVFLQQKADEFGRQDQRRPDSALWRKMGSLDRILSQNKLDQTPSFGQNFMKQKFGPNCISNFGPNLIHQKFVLIL